MPTALTQVTTGGVTYSDIGTDTPSGSPYTFINPQSSRALVWVSGGTVTSISLSSELIGLVNLGVLGGTWLLNPGASLTIVYILPPTIRWWCT